MILGFNESGSIVATAMNSEKEDNRYPIIHVLLKHRMIEGYRQYYLEFESLVDIHDANKKRVDEMRSALMMLISDDSNLNLPYLIDGEMYNFSNKSLIPSSKYSLLPVVKG